MVTCVKGDTGCHMGLSPQHDGWIAKASVSWDEGQLELHQLLQPALRSHTRFNLAK